MSRSSRSVRLKADWVYSVEEILALAGVCQNTSATVYDTLQNRLQFNTTLQPIDEGNGVPPVGIGTKAGQACLHSTPENEQATEVNYARMTDRRRDEIFASLQAGSGETEADKDLLLNYYEHRLDRGTPEFELAERLIEERRRQRKGPSEIY